MASFLDLLMRAPPTAEGDISDSLSTTASDPLLQAFIRLQASRAKDAVTAPRDAYRGDLQIFDPATGHVSDEAMDRANGMAGLAMTGGLGGAPRGAIGSGPARHFDVGDKFSVIAKDVGEGGRNYEIRPRGADGAPAGDPIGHAQLVQRPDGRWETGTIQVDPEHRGKGAASALYKAVEQDTGQPRIPSGSLLEDGYRFWQARDPEAVQYHQHVGDGIYLSPRRLMELLETAPTPADRVMGQAILDQVPAAGRTPEALARQFAIPLLMGGGAGAAAISNLGMGGSPRDMRY